MKNDIENIDDIKLLVNTFYGEIRNDELLGSIFNNVIQERWPEHLEKMYRFWQTVLLEDHTYFGSPFYPHAKLPIAKEHFERWLSIWHKTVNANFEGKKADEAKWRGDKMAQLFQSKIDYLRNNDSIPLV